LAAPPATTIQDAGRAGWLHAGVPPSGPLDPTAHAAANLAVGNPPGAAAIEVPLGALRLAFDGPVMLSVDGEESFAREAGDELEVAPCERAVRYVAIAGGIDVPVVLGSRATLLVAGLGGLQGRPLRRGDVLSAEPSDVEHRIRPGAIPAVSGATDPVVLRAWPGPHAWRLGQGALEHLLANTWRVSARSDRVGTRLEGTPVPRETDDRLPPAPMLRGAVQVTTDGTPIVLGPDHPVTGGYPVLAVVTKASQALLARLRPQRALRFALDEVVAAASRAGA
jgi:biotin-dependent carboxylase-like uncharacterized protein